MGEIVRLYMGDNLNDMTKEQLIEIIVEQAEMLSVQSKQHMADLKTLSNL